MRTKGRGGRGAAGTQSWFPYGSANPRCRGEGGTRPLPRSARRSPEGDTARSLVYYTLWETFFIHDPSGPWGLLASAFSVCRSLQRGVTCPSRSVDRGIIRIRALILVALLTTGACAGPTVRGARESVGVSSRTATTLPSIPKQRTVIDPSWMPFASVGGVTLTHPSRRVERVAFHQANHDGARQLTPLGTAAAAITLDSRDRETGSSTAADIVLDPTSEIRSPVTGKVKRAGTYVLYCKYSDDYVVVEPDEHPGWEVKILHIDGVRVRAGTRVVAGQTVLAPRATPLPFKSQVDEFSSAEPVWPHVHIEVIDPTIRDRPSPGGGCG